MSLDQNAINELKQIHLEETGEKLSDEEAWEKYFRGKNVSFCIRGCGNVVRDH
jgi:hypothetical protein